MVWEIVWTIFMFIIQLILEFTFSPLRWAWNFWQRHKKEQQELKECYPELAYQDEIPPNVNEVVVEVENERDRETRIFLEDLSRKNQSTESTDPR